ncbi:hypothetical protein ACH5RR_021604 [Cinchona calisaya]|uniref:Uncharacterized protein n=1 Tax=Cinchona calisaya TaxID=153742 RepID=A0ABD2ZLB9_9GENT
MQVEGDSPQTLTRDSPLYSFQVYRTNWLGVGLLRDRIQGPPNQSEEELKVADLFDEENGWDVSKISFSLPPELISTIDTIHGQTEYEFKDTIKWKDSWNGVFSSKSALRIIEKSDRTFGMRIELDLEDL